MPSKSKAQHNLMAMVAHDPKAAKRLGIPQSVGKEFMKADKKTKKYDKGGDVENMSTKDRIKATAHKALNKTVGKVGSLPFYAHDYVMDKVTKNPERKRNRKRISDQLETVMREQEEGAYFKKGGAVRSSASSRADGIASRGKTRGKFV